MNTRNISALMALLLLMLASSCSDVHMTLPLSPKGDRGISAYSVWKQQVMDGTIQWNKDQTAVVDYFKYLKGSEGDAGADGKTAYDLWVEALSSKGLDDPLKPGQPWNPTKNSITDYWMYLTGATGEAGSMPYIGANGNWFIGTYDTQKQARGERAVSPTVTIDPKTGHWMINDQDMGVKAPTDGKDGRAGVAPTVTISGGKWVIDGNPTNVSAAPVDGQTSVIAIGDNNNWFIDGDDTGQTAFPTDGANGSDGSDAIAGDPGMSAYELWKDEIAGGTVPNPKVPGEMWDPNKNSLADFFYFLSGKSISPADNGKPDTEIGTPGKETVVVLGAFNVIAQYSFSEYSEYVRPEDGGVLYRVFDDEGALAPGARVKGMPGMDPEKVFTAGADGSFVVPAKDLPSIQDVDARYGTAKEVTINGITEESAKNTYVPNRVDIKADFASDSSIAYADVYGAMRYVFNVYRRLNPEDNWSVVPSYITYTNNLVLVQVKGQKDSNPVDSQSIFANVKKSDPTAPSFYVYIKRPVVGEPSPEDPKRVTTVTDKYYFSINPVGTFYGVEHDFNGTFVIVPVQNDPKIASIKLKGRYVNDTLEVFSSATMTLDFSNVNLNNQVAYPGSFKKVTSDVPTKDFSYIDLSYISQSEARAINNIYIRMSSNGPNGVNYTIDSSDNPSGFDNPTVELSNVYLGSSLVILPADTRYLFYSDSRGYSLEKKADGSYELTGSPETVVTVEP